MPEPYQRCVLDASVLIAHLAHEKDREESTAVLEDAESGEIEIFMPMVARVEVTRYGKSTRSFDHAAANRLTRFFDSTWFNWVEVDRRLADAARLLVQTTSIRTGIDALYLATGLQLEADMVFSWDANLLDVDLPELQTKRPYGMSHPRLDL